MIDAAQDDVSRYYGPLKPVNDLAEVCVRNSAHFAAAVREVRIFIRGKPPAIRNAGITVIYHLIAIARGRTSPQLYAALGENIKRMGGK